MLKKAAFVFFMITAPLAGASHLSQADVDALLDACEASRESKLAPERVAVVERCMREEGLDQGSCSEKNKNYGEATTGAIRKLGKYYDEPECEEAYSARKHFKLNPGR